MFIGKKIKELAEERKMTATRLATLLGVTRPAVSAIYEKEDVNSSIIKECARIFNVPVSYFFDEEPTPNEPKKRKGCGGAILAAAEALAGSQSHEALEEENARLREELTSLQRQLIACNNRYIALLERELGYTSTEKGDSATA